MTNLVEKESPEKLESTMQEYLIKTKKRERGNLSFSGGRFEDVGGDDSCQLRLSQSASSATTGQNQSQMGVTQIAVVCEAITALERAKEAEKELKLANMVL